MGHTAAMGEDPDEREFVGINLQRSQSLHIRHEQMLQKWPLLDEEWARRVDAARLARRDTTPGAATFGR